MTGKAKIKLMIFVPTLECGGSEKYVSLLCNNIDTQRFCVCLAVLNNSKPFYKITNEDVDVIDLGAKRVLFSLSKIKRVIREFNPDIVFTVANHLNLYFAIFRKVFPKNIKMVARESSIVSINNRRAKMPWLYNRLVKKYYDRFDLIICQSAYMQRDMVAGYNISKNKTTIIHNPVNDHLPPKNNLQDDEGAGKDYKFLTVSRLSEEKGMERLIHSVGLLSLPFRFYIVGEGDKRAYLQNLVRELGLEEHIFFEGQKADPFSGMEDADLFLMGSYYEGFPNSLLEAGMLGIPVIAFNVPGGINEIIIPEQTGLLADDNDIIGFAKTIKDGLTLQFNRDSIIETTRKRFSIDKIIPETESTLANLLVSINN